MSKFLHGELVRLCREEPDTLVTAYGRWNQDSEWQRLMDTGISRVFSDQARKSWFEKMSDPNSGNYFFNIRSLADDTLIGDVGLDGANNPNGEAFVGIAIGERNYWGQGYGSDAMRLILKFGFMVLNLRRISLNVFEYNPRAIRSYEKVGFQHEGRQRGYLQRDGQRYDVYYMGILRSEWEERYAQTIDHSI